jgi:hypothetical protein
VTAAAGQWEFQVVFDESTEHREHRVTDAALPDAGRRPNFGQNVRTSDNPDSGYSRSQT